VIKTNFSG